MFIRRVLISTNLYAHSRIEAKFKKEKKEREREQKKSK